MRPTALIVEPDRQQAQSYAKILARCQYKPIYAKNGHEALTWYHTLDRPPAVIILNAAVSDVPCADIIEEVRAIPRDGRSRVIVNSDHAGFNRHLSVWAIDSLLVQPVGFKDLFRALVPKRVPVEQPRIIEIPALGTAVQRPSLQTDTVLA
ncbi:MAG: hypothetical protein R3264_06210 [Anaerolineae bacterium]|nr:hypothetical protein [Anaerolineae bacterium]